MLVGFTDKQLLHFEFDDITGCQGSRQFDRDFPTLCIGLAASMGSLLLTAGEKGLRFALPNARILLHQPSGGFQGQASDIERHAEDIIKMKRRLNEIYVKHTGKDYETIDKTLDRDYFLTAQESCEFGLIDKVLTSRDAIDAGDKA